MKKAFFYLLALPFVIGCMPSVEDDLGIPKPDILSHNVSSLSGSEFDVVMSGKCPKETARLYATIEDSTEYQEVKSSASGPGSFYGTCSNGTFTLKYRVPDPFTSRKITFQLRVRTSEGRMGDIETYTINYKQATPPVPGFAIVSVAGLAGSNTGHFFLTSGGQPISTIEKNDPHKGLEVNGSPSGVVRIGVLGILLAL